MAKTDFVALWKLQQVASGTALTNGLAPVQRELIANMYLQKSSQTIIKRCRNGILWVDKYYVAYQLGDGDVKYTYIAKPHIVEEVCAYRHASKERGEKITLPADILRCFRAAGRRIQMTGQSYWIATPWAKMVDGPDD